MSILDLNPKRHSATLEETLAGTLEGTLAHLDALVGFDTQNPPRAIESASPIFRYLQDALSGFEFEYFDAGNGCIGLLALRGQPSLLFNFHIDTVPVCTGWDTNPHQLEVTRDTRTTESAGQVHQSSLAGAVGLGACDIKGAVACMLQAASQTDGPLALLFTSDEENGNSAAVRLFLAQNKAFNAVVVAEPTQGKAILAHRGIETARARFSGLSGHGSESRTLHDNAIHKAANWTHKALSWIQEQGFSYQMLEGLPFNVGKIQGGIKANMIAAECELTFGFRPLPGQDGQALLTELQDLAANKEDLQLTPGFTGPTLPAANRDLQAAMSESAALANELELDVGAPVSFWTEASLFSEAGFTAIVYGPGDIAQAHTANEWVALSQLEQVANQYVTIIQSDKK